jgi:hypothetical protein
MGDFELFKSECLKWIEFFGLKDYRIAFDDKVTVDDAFAQCSTSLPHRTCVLRFESKELDEFNEKNRDVKKDAFHEVCHLLLAELLYIAECRYVNDGELRAEEERIVRILENTIYKEEKEKHIIKPTPKPTGGMKYNQR